MHRAAWPGVAIAIGLVSGCATTPSAPASSQSSAHVRPSPARAQPVDLDRGLQAVLRATDITGQTVGQASPEQRATALIVFASWCNPCRNELALLGELMREEPRLRVIGINAYEEFDDRSDEQRLYQYLDESAPWLQVVRADASLMKALGTPRKVPTVFLYDGRGKLVEAYLRARRDPPTRQELKRALARVIIDGEHRP